jgi:DnaK suppressor protein
MPCKTPVKTIVRRNKSSLKGVENNESGITNEENKMTSADKEKLAAVLLAKRKHLSISLCTRDGIAVETASDALDDLQLKTERELATQNLNRDSSMLRHIDLALSKIVNGTYGICLHCEEDISLRRMAALPWAAFCIECQEMADRGEIDMKQHFKSITRSA